MPALGSLALAPVCQVDTGRTRDLPQAHFKGVLAVSEVSIFFLFLFFFFNFATVNIICIDFVYFAFY